MPLGSVCARGRERAQSVHSGLRTPSPASSAFPRPAGLGFRPFLVGRYDGVRAWRGARSHPYTGPWPHVACGCLKRVKVCLKPYRFSEGFSQAHT